MDWEKGITLAIAVYAALLSTVIQLANWKKSKPQIKTSLRIGMLGYDNGYLSDLVLILEAANVGERPATLASEYILLPDGRQLLSFNPNADVDFPHELAPGKSCRIWFDRAELKKALSEAGYSGRVWLTGFYHDATGAKFRSRKFRYDAG